MNQRGGIRTIEDLRLRCRIDNETGCWRWAGAKQEYGGSRAAEPRVWLADHDCCVNGKRAAAILSGRTPKRGQLVYAKCLNSMCVRPDHQIVGTAKERGAWLAAQGVLKGNPSRVAQNTRMSRGRSSINMELARWARESEQTGVEVAHALDIGIAAVSRIRRHETWREQMQAASVFSFAAEFLKTRSETKETQSDPYLAAVVHQQRTFIGATCGSCGGRERYTSGRSCVACQKEKSRLKHLLARNKVAA